jgi:hypothetical protein
VILRETLSSKPMEKWFSNIFKYEYCPQQGLYINGSKYSSAQIFTNGTMELYKTDDIDKPTRTFTYRIASELKKANETKNSKST